MFNSYGTLIAIFGLLLGLLLVFGIVAGQFRRGVIRELRESLATAATELGLQRDIIIRLEEALKTLERKCAALESDNKALKQTLDMGTALAPFVRDEFARFERRVIERHRVLAEALPDEIRIPLTKSLDVRVEEM